MLGIHHKLREKSDHPLEKKDIVKLWKIRKLKESARMLGHNDFHRRRSIEIHTTREPVIRKERERDRERETQK